MEWEKHVRRVVPYIAGEQPKNKNVIKLNTNENPYPPAPGVEKVLHEFEYGILNKYPDSEVIKLREVLAKKYQVEPEQVFVGVGSDDVLAMSFLTYFNSDKPILFPDVTYSFYDVWAELYRIPYKRIPLAAQFEINKADYMRENGGIVLANPNAPTGLYTPLDEIEEIIKANQNVVVIVDEAYIDFGGESSLRLLEKYENLLVVQTFSKSRSMAGMRIGYAIGNRKLIAYLNDAKFSFNSYTMNAISIAAGVAAVEDEAYFQDTVAKVIETREYTKRELNRLGFLFPDSSANFIFARHGSVSGQELFEMLRQNQIYVRHWNKDRISDYLRISIGTREEMEQLIGCLDTYLKGKNINK